VNSAYEVTGVGTEIPLANVKTIVACTGVSISEGMLAWPESLVRLSGSEPFRRKIDAFFTLTVTRLATGSMHPDFPLELDKAIDRLANHWKKKEHELSPALNAQGDRFLGELKAAVRVLQVLAAPARSTAGLKR